MSCRAIEPLLMPFNDGELGTDKAVEVEQHIAECQLCAERLRLILAMRVSLRRVVQERARPTAAFQSRLAAALEAEQQREWEARVLEREAARSRMLSWRTILPVAAAAGLTLVWAASTQGQREQAVNRREVETAQSDAAAGIDDVLEQLVNHHVRGKPEITEPRLLPTYEDEVGVRLRVPSLMQYGARWEGGSVVRFKNHHVASLRYRLGNDRVTVYLYDSRRVPIENRLQQRYVGNETVYVGTRRGYSIGVTNRRGIGCAVASDLSDAETAEITAQLDL